MNKIINWTCGSFFRTIGRLLVYVLIGVIISHFINFGDLLNGFSITNLFFEKVNASTYQYQWISGSKWSNDWGSTYNNTTNADGYYYLTDTITSGQNNNSKSYWFKFDNVFNITNQVDSFDVNILMKPTSLEYIALSGTQINCIEDNPTTSCTFQANSNGIIVENQFGLTLEYFYDSETHFIPCYSKGSSGYIISFTCPISTNKINGFHIVINSLRTMNYTLGHYFGLNFKRDTTQQIIDSQNQTTQQIIDSQNQTQQAIQNGTNQTISTITDDTSPAVNGTIDNDTLVGYLPAGPVDAVLNLPLSILQNLVNKLAGVCSPIVITLPFVNKQMTIPCIDTIFSGISGLNLGLSAVFGIIAGLMLYNYLVYLYNWVDDITSLKHARPRLFGAKSDAENWGGN